jgi:hypothetical protein
MGQVAYFNVCVIIFQNQLNSILNSNNESPNKRQRLDDLLWIPDDIKFHSGGPVQVKLLCGADLLESFAVPGLWAEDDVSCLSKLCSEVILKVSVFKLISQ